MVTRPVTGDGWPPSLTFHPSLLNRPNYCICLSFEPQMIHSGHGGRLHFSAPVWRAPLIVSFRGSLVGGWFGHCVSQEGTLPITLEGISLNHEHHPSEALGFWLSAAEGSWLFLLGSLGFDSSSMRVSNFPLCSLTNCASSIQWGLYFLMPVSPSLLPSILWLGDHVIKFWPMPCE